MTVGPGPLDVTFERTGLGQGAGLLALREPVMTDNEVERALGYAPCVCGKLDGTWHSKCYRGKTVEQIATGYKRAFAVARRHLKQQRDEALRVTCSKTPNIEDTQK